MLNYHYTMRLVHKRKRSMNNLDLEEKFQIEMQCNYVKDITMDNFKTKHINALILMKTSL